VAGSQKDNSQDIDAWLAASQLYLLHIYRAAHKKKGTTEGNVIALIAPQTALEIQFKWELLTRISSREDGRHTISICSFHKYANLSTDADANILPRHFHLVVPSVLCSRIKMPA